MLTPQEQSRYSKQIILPEFGIKGQEALAAASVLVVGAGGLGCPILQYLAVAGVGTIGIVDGDTVDLSNLQRQVLYTEMEVGKSKAIIAAKKLRSLNPNVTINQHPVFLKSNNALDIIRDYDIIVDGSDNFATRYLLNDACVILDKPLVSGAIYKFEGQVSVLNFRNGPTYRCIFPEPPNENESPNCADIGVLATLPGIIGTIQANEVIKIITGIGEVLSGKLLVIDTLTMNTHIFNFKLNEANKNITRLYDGPEVCEVTFDTIEYDAMLQLQGQPDVLLVDVREVEEHAMGNYGGINIPLSQFEAAYQALDPDDTIIVYCASGARSKQAAKLLRQKGFKKILNLKNGYSK
jgi:sulfur-carrier protein adenylyltransferase/sulfurtransferase